MRLGIHIMATDQIPTAISSSQNSLFPWLCRPVDSPIKKSYSVRFII